MLIRPLHDAIKLSIFFVQFSCLSRVILRNLDVLHFLTFSPFIVALKLSLFNCPLLLKNHFHSFVYIYLEFNCSFVHPCLLCLFVGCNLLYTSFRFFLLLCIAQSSPLCYNKFFYVRELFSKIIDKYIECCW